MRARETRWAERIFSNTVREHTGGRGSLLVLRLVFARN
jgi:hypothetical protein